MGLGADFKTAHTAHLTNGQIDRILDQFMEAYISLNPDVWTKDDGNGNRIPLTTRSEKADAYWLQYKAWVTATVQGREKKTNAGAATHNGDVQGLEE